MRDGVHGGAAQQISSGIKGKETNIKGAITQAKAIASAVTEENKVEDPELSKYKTNILTALSFPALQIAKESSDKPGEVKEFAPHMAQALVGEVSELKDEIDKMCKVKDSLPGETITGAIGSQALAVQKAIEQYASDKQANTIIANADKIAKDIVGITEIKLAAPGSGIPFFILRHVIAWVLREKASDIAGVIESDSGDGTTTAGIINPVLNEIKDNKLVVAAFVKNVIAGIILSGAGGITKGGVLERR